MREVLTYSRRGSGLSDAQEAAWAEHAPTWWIPDEAADQPSFEVQGWFEREAPLVVEIGSGIGESTVTLASGRPSYNILGLEVWRPGIAETFRRLESAGVGNVRMMSVDAVWSLQHLLPEASVTELWTFFPDPWPKQRHHRRRLVNPGFVSVATDRLVPGGLWRLATDWVEYAEHMQRVLGDEPGLDNVYDGPAPRWADRPLTRFERRGLRAGHTITDLAYRRR